MEKKFLKIANTLVCLHEIVSVKESENVAGYTEVNLKNGDIIYWEKPFSEVIALLAPSVLNA